MRKSENGEGFRVFTSYKPFQDDKTTMETDYILDLFGHSIYYPDLDKTLTDFNAICKDKSKLERYDSIKSESTGITFTLHIPPGATYVPGSVTVANEAGITDLNNPKFSIANIASSNFVDFTLLVS